MASTTNVKAVITADDRASRVLASFGHRVAETGKRLLKVTSGFAVAGGLIGIKMAGDLETARQSFIALLGSAEKADKTMARIKKEAVKTPFEIKGLTTATQLLSQVTKDGDKSIEILLDVGEALAFAGKGQAELDRVIINLQQIANTGKVTALDLKQFGFAGINIAELLAEHFDTTKEKAMDMIKNSDDAFGDLTKAFKTATDEGGRFAGAFEAQGGTFNQVLSNLKDAFQLAMADIVKNVGLFEFVKDVIGGTGDWIAENSDKIVNALNRMVEFIRDKVVKAWDILSTQFEDQVLPILKEIWTHIKEDLMPALKNFWQNVIVPMIPVIGVALGGALLVVLDAIELLIPVISTLIDWLSENEVIVWALFGAWVALKGAMAIGAVVTAVSGVITALGTGMAGATVSTLGLKATLTAMMIPATGTFALFAIAGAGAFALIMESAKDTIKAIGGANRAIESLYTSDMVAIKKARQMKDMAGRGFVTAEESERLLTGAEGILGSIRNRGGNQLGGNVTAGAPFLVGEGGGNPEMFVPSRSGRVEPLDGAGGGGTINLNVNIGMYSGTGVEKRKIAEAILESMREIASAKGVSVQEIMA